MMNATERDREFIAGLTTQGPRLHEPKMMRVGWFATAEQARLLSNVTKMRLVTISAGGGNGEPALVDGCGLMITLGGNRFPLVSCSRNRGVFHAFSPARLRRGIRRRELRESLFESLLDHLGVRRGKAVLADQSPARPNRGLVSRCEAKNVCEKLVAYRCRLSRIEER